MGTELVTRALASVGGADLGDFPGDFATCCCDAGLEFGVPCCGVVGCSLSELSLVGVASRAVLSAMLSLGVERLLLAASEKDMMK